MSEIFARFEVNREPRWPILLRLLVVSFAFHVAVVASVLYVPPVRDAFNIATLLADTSFVDRPYLQTQIGDDVRVLHLAKFHYPEGYFAMAAGITAVPEPTPLPWASGVKSGIKSKPLEPEPSPSPSPSPSPVDAEAVNANTAVSSASPSIQPDVNANANVNAQANASQTEQEKAQAEKAQEQLEKTAAANGVDLPVDNEINRQPLKDLASYASNLKKDGKLNLDQNFEVVVEAELDETAKLQKPTFVQKSGDPALIDLAGRMVAALNDSRLLVLLKALNEGKPTKLVFMIRQDQTALVARIESDVSSEQSARQKASVFNMMLAAGEKARRGKDEAVLMRNTAASAEGKKVVFSFSMPREAVGEMIKKQIASNANTKQG
ncbi:MAG: hypothetical protein C5B44_04180 [Acidobacteria bacterium]|nr:MAG: hypothetical protein C5B44_04180 [Acidobacteriota bacterium]